MFCFDDLERKCHSLDYYLQQGDYVFGYVLFVFLFAILLKRL